MRQNYKNNLYIIVNYDIRFKKMGYEMDYLSSR